MEPLVSIIVPIYNSEAALERCIDSIIRQDYPNLEILLMDDGSSDRSPQICDRYAAQDSRITVVHKPNSGVSDTRNQALDRAKGTYIQFLDSDDWITPNATRMLVRTAEDNQADLVIADFYRVVGDRLSQKGDIDEAEVMDREEFAGHMLENPANFYYGVLWNKLYRRDLLESHHLRMDEQLSWCEDFLFNLEYIRYAKRFVALQAPVYYYVKTKGSLASQGMSLAKTVKMKRTVFELYHEFFKEVYDEEGYEDRRLQVYSFLLASAKDGIVAPTFLPGSYKLGEESSSLRPEAAAAPGPAMALYRNRHAMEYFIDSAAKKNGLTLNEALALLYLDQGVNVSSVEELADYMSRSVNQATLALSKLEKKKYLTLETKKAVIVSCTFTPKAQPVLADLSTAMNDLNDVCYKGFTPEEREIFRRLSGKVKGNIVATLS